MERIVASLDGAATNPAPVVSVYPSPPGKNRRIGLIVLPGGGYAGYAEHEGPGYAQYFSDSGITSFVVDYRLGPQGFRHPAMLEDALAAISTVRSMAERFNLDTNKIGIIGSSAGGHLAASVLTGYSRYSNASLLKPDFGILCYPVITMGEFTHAGSRLNLLGEFPSYELIQELSCEKQVTSDTPPCFIWHTVEDQAVPIENSLMFASALRKNKVPFELHCYERGRHGLGLRTPLAWASDCVRWIFDLFRNNPI